MIRTIKALLVAGVFLMLVATPAMADVFHVEDFLLEDILGDPDAELAFVQEETGDPTLQFLAKKNEDGSPDEGDLADEFMVSFMGISADVSWDLTGTGFAMGWILIKDGAIEGDHLYGLWGVTDDQAIIGGGEVGFVDQERDVSHVSFFGFPGVNGEEVPEPSILLVLGAGLLGLGIRRRRR